MSYQPLKITGNSTGLVQSREEFLLPDDAYPILENAYVWRERIIRKKGYYLLGRLQRNFTALSLGNDTAGATTTIPNIFTFLTLSGIEAPTLVQGSLVITVGGTDASTFTDTGLGTFTVTGMGLAIGSSINYQTGAVVLQFFPVANGGQPITANFSYYPNLPVMGIRIRENNDSTNDQTIFFDQVYAYDFNGALNTFEEFLPGTTWTGNNSDFFWSTNYWIDKANNKIFWVTNYSASGNNDPIRYTNGQSGTNWIDFTPIIDAAGTVMWQALAILPFRGRLVAFNTSEGLVKPGLRFTNRIRWAEIGNPFTVVSGAPPNDFITTVVATAWRDDIRGKGGFLDIPTSEDIVSVGFVRDNLVIYCERSTWQLRYTGRTIAPFQIEKVNSELGAEGTFSTIQFDTSLVGIGDKGIVECDSYKSELIDVKIPDFVFKFNNANNGPKRVHGIRDFELRLCYWTYCSDTANGTFPDKRLLYNYENDSWATFTDSLTTLGTFQEPSSRTWLNTPIPWIECNFTWTDQPLGTPDIVGGNQQGFIERLDELTTNDPSLYISAITALSPNPTEVTSPIHNLQSDMIIQISGIPAGSPFANLNAGINPNTGLPFNNNNGIFLVVVLDTNRFTLWVYDPKSLQFDMAQIDVPSGAYIGGGVIAVRDNFDITSKRFNFIDDGKSIQLGYVDILMNATSQPNPGEISMNVYLNYDDNDASNTYPKNNKPSLPPVIDPDLFFNSVIPTTQSTLSAIGGSKFWQRVYCSTRANFLTIQYTFNNAQMAGIAQQSDVQIDAQILWLRKAGRNTVV